MAFKGCWPRAVFYDSKTTLFDWASSWREAAETLVAKYRAPCSGREFLQTWIRQFEGLHRRAAFHRYAPVTDIARESMLDAFRMFGVKGSPDDVSAFTDAQEKVGLFPDTEAALTDQQKLGVRIFIYSDVETKYLNLYVSKFEKFHADFVGTTEESRVLKPNPRTYEYVLRRTGMHARDVLYCAAPLFDVQGAMSAGMIAAWLRRPDRLSFLGARDAGDLPADYEAESLHDVTRIVQLNRG
jgi:2-haloacid dehalogenase